MRNLPTLPLFRLSHVAPLLILSLAEAAHAEVAAQPNPLDFPGQGPVGPTPGSPPLFPQLPPPIIARDPATVANRLLTGSVAINAGRHMVGNSIGSIGLSGGSLTDEQGTRITINSGTFAQMSNGLRLTSATNFTFNGAGQTHNLAVSLGRTGTYSISNFSLPAAGANNYVTPTGTARQDFGGTWRTTADYGNIFGEHQSYTFNNPTANTPQPNAPAVLTSDPDTYQSLKYPWILARGTGVSANERINPLVSGEVTANSSLDLSGITFNATGTAVADRTLYTNQINIGRVMFGQPGFTVNRTDTVSIYTSGSSDHYTTLNVNSFNLSNGNGLAASMANATTFDSSASVGQVQLTGSIGINTGIQGRGTNVVNIGSQIQGEGLSGENAQSSLLVGYTWNVVQDNTLVARNLLIIDSASRSDTRSYFTEVYHGYSTETHTNIGWTGGSVQVSGAKGTGLHGLGNYGVTAIAEGLAGENANASDSFNATYAGVAQGTYSLTSSTGPGGELTAGSVVTISDTGGGLFQNNTEINSVSLTGGQNLDFNLTRSGGGDLIEHGGSRTLTVNFIGNSTPVALGQLGRVSRAYLDIALTDRTNLAGIQSAWGGSGTISQGYSTDGNALGAHTFQIEKRFDAPSSSSGTSSFAAGTNLRTHGLGLENTASNTSERFTTATDAELIDSSTTSSGRTVSVQFVKLDSADSALVDALEQAGSNAASLAGIYGGDQGGAIFASDIVNLTGLNGIQHVLQVGYDTEENWAAGAQLLWRYDYTGDNDEPFVAWVNAVLGNSNINDLNLSLGTLSLNGSAMSIQDYLDGTRYTGSYEDYLADNGFSSQLGAWGVDATNQKVWAVIDHNSSFVVAVPETSSALLWVAGAGLLTIRRKRR